MKKDEQAKPRRQEKIREIVENHIVETQEDLTAFLRREHIAVTQATVSRDVKELMLVKVPIGDGRSRYAFPKAESGVRRENRKKYVDKQAAVLILQSYLDSQPHQAL